MAPVGVTIIVDQNPQVRKMLNTTIVARKGTLRKSVGVTIREKRAKNMSHQMLKGVWQIPRMMAKFSTTRQQLFQKEENDYLTSGS